MKSTINLFLLAAITAAFTTCQSKKEQAKNYIIPVDFSSSRDSSVIAWYKATIVTSILNKAGSKDKVIVLPVDRHSELWGQEIFKVDYGEYEYGNEHAGLQREQIERKNFSDTVNSAASRFITLFEAAQLQRKGSANGTDILGSLRQCQKYLSADYQNVIVFLSDMEQSTEKGELDLERKDLSKLALDASIEKAERIDLDNCKIVVLTGPQVKTSPANFNLVKGFWTDYFTKCKAQLIDYSSAAVTKLEELVESKTK